MFTKGDVYYRITYPNIDMLYPSIETFVFIGMNLSDEDEEDTWYFQFARSYAKSGSVLESSQGDRAVVCATNKDKEDMLDLSGLMSELKAASVRRTKKSQSSG